jgi:hypothetical protein
MRVAIRENSTPDLQKPLLADGGPIAARRSNCADKPARASLGVGSPSKPMYEKCRTAPTPCRPSGHCLASFLARADGQSEVNRMHARRSAHLAGQVPDLAPASLYPDLRYTKDRQHAPLRASDSPWYRWQARAVPPVPRRTVVCRKLGCPDRPRRPARLLGVRPSCQDRRHYPQWCVRRAGHVGNGGRTVGQTPLCAPRPSWPRPRRPGAGLRADALCAPTT